MIDYLRTERQNVMHTLYLHMYTGNYMNIILKLLSIINKSMQRFSIKKKTKKHLMKLLFKLFVKFVVDVALHVRSLIHNA